MVQQAKIDTLPSHIECQRDGLCFAPAQTEVCLQFANEAAILDHNRFYARLKKAEVLGIDDKNGINACKLLRVVFTTAVGILIRSREKGLLEESDALEKLASLAKHGRYRDSIIEDARQKLEDKP